MFALILTVFFAICLTFSLRWFLSLKSAPPNKSEASTNQDVVEEIASRKIDRDLYLRFIEEKERRINIYVRGGGFESQIKNLKGQLDYFPKNPAIFDKIEWVMAQYNQWTKERDDENAKFIRLMDEIKLRFNHSPEFDKLIGEISMKPFGGYGIEAPTKEDIQSKEAWGKWINQSFKQKDEFIEDKVRRPLENLEKYLKLNLNL